MKNETSAAVFGRVILGLTKLLCVRGRDPGFLPCCMSIAYDFGAFGPVLDRRSQAFVRHSSSVLEAVRASASGPRQLRLASTAGAPPTLTSLPPM